MSIEFHLRIDKFISLQQKQSLYSWFLRNRQITRIKQNTFKFWKHQFTAML